MTLTPAPILQFSLFTPPQNPPFCNTGNTIYADAVLRITRHDGDVPNIFRAPFTLERASGFDPRNPTFIFLLSSLLRALAGLSRMSFVVVEPTVGASTWLDARPFQRAKYRD